jgi:hypothetical protein
MMDEANMDSQAQQEYDSNPELRDLLSRAHESKTVLRGRE